LDFQKADQAANEQLLLDGRMSQEIVNVLHDLRFLHAGQTTAFMGKNGFSQREQDGCFTLGENTKTAMFADAGNDYLKE